MRPEPEVEGHPAEPHAAAPSELEPLALVARHAPTQGDEAEPLFAAQVQGRPPPVVHQVRGERGRADRVGEVRNVRDRELGFRLDMVRERRRVADGGAGARHRRVPVESAVLARVGPGDRRTDVVHPEAQLERPRDPCDADVATDAVTELVTRLRVLRQATPVGRDGVGAAEDDGTGDEAAVPREFRVPHAEVVVQRAAEVDPRRGIAPDAARIPERRGEPGLDDAVGQHVVARVVLRGHRVVQEREQRVAQLKPRLGVQPGHHAHANALDVEAGVEQSRGATEPELVLGDELARLTQVHLEKVLPDAERHVVRGRGRLLHLVEQRRVQHVVQSLDRVEPGRVGTERRVVTELGDGVIAEELDEAEREGDRQLGLGLQPRARGDGAVRGVEAAHAPRAPDRDSSHPDATRVSEQALRGGGRRATDGECHEPKPHDRCAHGSPREGCR